MKDIRFMFIYSDIGTGSMSFSPAIEILSAVLRSVEVDIKLLHIHEKKDEDVDFEDIYSKVNNFHPDIIGISATSYQFKISNKIVEELKKRNVKSLFVLGGIHATISCEDLAFSAFDAFAIGEGEYALCELILNIRENKDIKKTPGFYFNDGGVIIKNPMAKVVENLDELPFRDYELFNVEKILAEKDGWFSIAFSRGCPYSCNFCINDKLKKVFQNVSKSSYYRINSVDRAIDELKYVISRYRRWIKLINLDDDLLLMDSEWFLDFAKKYYKEIFIPYQIKYAINGRANLMNEKIVGWLKKSGCDLVRVGFETGNENMRNMVLNKSLLDSELMNAFSLCRKYKLRSCAFTMLGIPHESEKSLHSTLQLLAVLKPTLIRLAIYEPFKGTTLYDYCIKNKLLDKEYDIPENCFEQSSLHFEEITNETLKRYHILFPWYLNCYYLPIKHRKKYYNAIKKFNEKMQIILNINSLKTDILRYDQELSMIMEKDNISHFRYLQNNPYYIQLWDEL